MAAVDLPLPAFAPSALTGLADETLAGLVAAGSDDAFAVLDQRYRRRLVRHARGFVPGGTADAEDAAQDALLRAVRALRNGRSTPPEAVGPWLHRIARNCALDLAAARRRAPVTAFDEDVTPRFSHAEDAHEAVVRRQRMSQVIDDVGGLPATQRSALVLRELEGRSYVDIADELDVTVPAVKSLLVRARAGLKRAHEGRAAALLPLPLLGRALERLASVWEPLSSTAAPKIACVAVVAAGSIPALAPSIQPSPAPSPREAAHAAPREPVARAAASSLAVASGPQAPVGSEASAADDPAGAAALLSDCQDGTVDASASSAQLLAAREHMGGDEYEYGSGCADALRDAVIKVKHRG